MNRCAISAAESLAVYTGKIIILTWALPILAYSFLRDGHEY